MARRLFVMTPGSDGQWWYCGGPDLDDAMRGFKNLVEQDVAGMLAGSDEAVKIDLEIRDMTDEEVAAIPEC